MWKEIKETITSKYFWIGFVEGFTIIPLFFDKRVKKLILRRFKGDSCKQEN